MSSVKAILIDDESRANSVLKELLLKSQFEIEIISVSQNLPKGVKEIKKHNPDVVFLDVQMPNYAGYEIANFFEKIDFEIIFITAFDKYAIKAFELCAIDYLVKPINRKRLDESLLKLQTRIKEKNSLAHYKTLLKTIQNKRQEKIVIPEMGNRRIININDIIAIEADGAYTCIYISDNPKLTTSRNLKYYENLLKDNSCFYRAHRSWLVNSKHLKNFNRTSSTLLLADEVEAKISRKQYDEFIKFCANSK